MDRFTLASALIITAATAQADPPEGRPYFYTWAAPSGGWSYVENASQVVRIYADVYSATDAGTFAAGNAYDQIDNPLYVRVTDPAHICLVIEHLGHWPPPGYEQFTCSFFRELDAIDPPPAWDPNAPLPPEIEFSQPWMGTGIDEVGDWMDLFIAAYDAEALDLDLEYPPFRVHLDSEIALSNSGSIQYSKALDAIEGDDRWATESVPGFGTQTMADLFDAAKTAYGWTGTLSSLVNENQEQNLANRPYFLWFFELTQRALDSAFDQAVFARARAAWSGCKASEYGHAATDGVMDDFGWYTGTDPSGQNPGVFGPQRRIIHGRTDPFPTSSQYIWNDFMGSTPPFRQSVWVTRAGSALGDFSAPDLYPLHKPHWGDTGNNVRRNYYLEGWPDAGCAGITLMNGRRWVESIINSEGGDESKIAPWLVLPGVVMNLGESYEVTNTEFRQLLAMLRAKKITEAILWWDDTSALDWSEILPIMDHVYTPQVKEYSVLTGTTISTPNDPKRLRYTLRTAVPEDARLDIESAPLGRSHVVALEVTFNYLPTTGTFGQLLLNLECSVAAEYNQPYLPEDIRGLIYVRNWDTGLYERKYGQGTGGTEDVFDDFVDTNSQDIGFGFFAPAYLPSASDFNWFETRRAFTPIDSGDTINDFGEVDVKIVLLRPNTSEAFIARFDLTQLVGASDYLPPPSSSMAAGADYDYSQVEDADDLLAFGSDWAIGAPAADFNNDGMVDAEDYADFVSEYQDP